MLYEVITHPLAIAAVRDTFRRVSPIWRRVIEQEIYEEDLIELIENVLVPLENVITSYSIHYTKLYDYYIVQCMLVNLLF